MIADVHLLTLMKTSRKIEVLLLRDLKKKNQTNAVKEKINQNSTYSIKMTNHILQEITEREQFEKKSWELKK